MAALKSLTGSIAVDCALLLAILYSIWSIRSYWQLRHIPGPFSWAISVFPLLRLHAAGKQYDGFRKISKQYGEIVRLAPKTIVVSDPDVLRRMSAARSPYTKSDWYGPFRLSPGKDNVFSQRNDKLHDDLRRKMAAGYSGKENPTLESDIDECVQDLTRLIDTKYISTGQDQKILELSQKIQYFTTDTITKLAFDAKFNDLRDDNDNFGYVKEVQNMLMNICGVVCIPAVLDFFTDIGLMQLLAPSHRSTFGLGKVFGIARAQVEERFDAEGNPKSKRNDMLGSFIKHGLSKEQAEQEVLLQLAAGSDTTATGLRSTLLCVMSNPRVYTRLISEIDEAKKSGKVKKNRESDQIVANEQARELPYLQACIKEGLRWLPPTPGMLGKKVPHGGDEILGYRIPAGISVATCVYSLHHNSALYGPDEEAYRPERWILRSDGGDEESVEQLKAMERNHELHWGSGKYQCLGKNVAQIELNKVIFELFDRFQFSLVNPARGLTSGCYGVWLQKDFYVSVRTRT